MKTAPLILAVVMMLTAVPTFADGNDLLQRCTLSLAILNDVSTATQAKEGMDGAYSFGYCDGIIKAVIQSNVIMKAARQEKLAFCLPDDLKQIQLTRVVVKYLQDHPATLQYSDWSLAATALNEAYPCTAVTPRK